MSEVPPTDQGPPALEMRALRREFGGKVAVDDIDLTVPMGSFFGIVGPNGAGKTTALSMAVGLLRPSAGQAFVQGLDVWTDPVEAKRRLGVRLDGLALPERLTGGELLTYWGRFRSMPADTVASRTAELLRVLELDDAEQLGTLVGEFSTGMRKKIGLATALLHAPKVLVFDEPHEAVDPVSLGRATGPGDMGWSSNPTGCPGETFSPDPRIRWLAARSNGRPGHDERRRGAPR